jgi:hypothetical protein
MNDQLDDLEINTLADQGDVILELRKRQQTRLRDQDALKSPFRETNQTCNKRQWALALIVFLLAFGVAFVVTVLVFGGELIDATHVTDLGLNPNASAV